MSSRMMGVPAGAGVDAEGIPPHVPPPGDLMLLCCDDLHLWDYMNINIYCQSKFLYKKNIHIYNDGFCCVIRKKKKKKNLRILKLANPSKLFTLHTPRVIRITLDLLLPTSHTGDGEPLAWLTRLGDPPVGIHGLAVNDRLAVAPVVVKVAHALTRKLGRPHEPREEVGPRPDLGT